MTKQSSRILAALAALCLSTGARSAEGMWTLDHPPTARMQQELGWAPDAAWLKRAMLGSVKVGNGCSGSFVSRNGLVLTNHHCVASCIDQLSNASDNLLETGFLAQGAAAERRCPALEVSRLEQISDVTREVAGATTGLDGNAFTAARNAVMARLAAACVAGDAARVRCDVVELYHGGEFRLYRYRRFTDVRLAFAPERQAAAFGGDPDNFNFPRYDLDMALLRAYEDGKPAAIATFFAFDTAGPAADEPVVVTGHPGGTERELTVAQLALQRDLILLDGLLRRAEWRGVLTEYRTRGPEQARIALNDLTGVENGYKVVRGRLEALLDPAVFRRKASEEDALRSYAAAHPALAAKVGPAWDAIAAAEAVHRTLFQPFQQLERGEAFDSRYFTIARALVRGASERPKPNEERLPEFNDNVLPRLQANLMSAAPVHPELEALRLTYALTKFRERLGVDAPVVRQVLAKRSPAELAAAMVAATRLGDPAVRRALWDGGAAAIARSDDPFIRLAVDIDPAARAVRLRYEREVQAVVQKNTSLIAEARFAAYGDTTYPDATSSLRLSYGRVTGWTEAGTVVPPFTRFEGAFARATGAEPFALPPSWLAARDRIDGSVALDLATSNDIIGGNSGSPLLNRKGDLVGLMFDGNIHSLGGDYAYDPERNRSVAVGSAGMLEAMEHIYGAHALAEELRGH